MRFIDEHERVITMLRIMGKAGKRKTTVDKLAWDLMIPRYVVRKHLKRMELDGVGRIYVKEKNGKKTEMFEWKKKGGRKHDGVKGNN